MRFLSCVRSRHEANLDRRRDLGGNVGGVLIWRGAGDGTQSR